MARSRSATVEHLDDALKRRTAPAAEALVETLEDNRVRCLACGHRCLILDGLDGICRVRFNRGGTLYAPRGYVGGLQVDPIEKKPFFHVLPGSPALSFGMLGCDLHCGYCQNWLTSQVLRDDAAVVPPRDIEAAEILELAASHATPVIVSTYNEPLITSEWAVEIFKAAREAGLLCGYVSNGNATPEVLDFLAPWVRLYKVDLKGFRDRAYRKLGGTLKAVTDTLQGLHERGFWVEIVTLLVPGFNDSEKELRDLTGFVASIDPSIPWHVTAFHGDYKMSDVRDTTATDLHRAAEIGREAGLRFVYAGNRPGQLDSLEDTRCPDCGSTLVRRRGFRVLEQRLDGASCPDCSATIPGVWSVPA